MSVILYSTHCPKCNILTNKLKLKNIEFEEVNDVNIMIEKGYDAVPVLVVDGKVMNYAEAVNWVNNQEV